MAFEFIHFNNLCRPNFGGFCATQMFVMPAVFTFRLPQIPVMPLFSFLMPSIPAVELSEPEVDKSLYKEDIYNMLYPKTTGTRFDSYNFTGFNIFDTSLKEFTPVNYTIPQPNLTLPKLDTSLYSNRSSSVRRKYSSTLAPSTTTTIEEVKKIYNKDKGKKLAQATINGLSRSEKGYCARAVKNGIVNAGLGAYQSGHASAMPSILSNNSNFKEVKVASSDLDKLPAGCIICYAPGDCGYDAKHGHTETTDGNGNAISFFVNHNIKKSDKVRVFVPV